MEEIPGYFGTAFGIVSCPDTIKLADTAVVILNAGLIHRVGPFRLSVLLSRRLAERGVLSLRVDQSGKGDSPRRPLASDESVFADFEDIAGELDKSYGVKCFLLVGLCSGADDAVRVAERNETVRGMVLLDGFAPKDLKYYVKRYGPKLLKPKVWQRRIGELFHSEVQHDAIDQEAVNMFDYRDWDPAGSMIAKMRAMLERDVQMLTIFTGDVDDYYSYEGQLGAGLGKYQGLEEHYFPQAKHVYPIRRHRDRLVETIVSWVDSHYLSKNPIKNK